MESVTAVVMGLSGAGKTTLLRSYCNDHREIFPTAGFQVCTLQSNQRGVVCYDCSGAGVTRSNWPMLAEMSDCALFVIDSTDDDHFAQARRHLMLFLEKTKSMRSKGLCICLNKCDVRTRKPRQVYEKALETDRILKLVARLYIKETSGYTKEGIDQCINWVAKAT